MVLLLIAGLLIAAAVPLWYLPRNKRKLWKLRARIPAGILIFASGLALLGFLFRGLMCGMREFPPVSSSDGKLLAQLREADCGAVDHFHSSVQIVRLRQDFFAHIFGKHGRATTVFTIADDPRFVDLAWKDNRTLLIRYPNDYRYVNEYSCQSQMPGIRIECVGYVPDDHKWVPDMPAPVARWLYW
jgi:hypothetical protein